MKIMTVLGTRPEIIRLSRVIEKLDQFADHCLVHTGQNFDPRLSDLFFDELKVRRPDHFLHVKGDLGQQVGAILSNCERLIREERPDRFLILGDTNSGLSALIAKRLGVPVFHMEAGNRCFDDRVPEEVNRRIIDHSSDILLPYTERSRDHLLREGIPCQRIFVTGNPILEVLEHYRPEIAASDILDRLELQRRGYYLVTLHRAENVDRRERLDSIFTGISRLSHDTGLPVIISTHPRLRARLESDGTVHTPANLRFLEPFGFFDFVALEQQARCVLSDSGTVQEECSLFGVPNVTLRDVTERPETIECGSNVVSGADEFSIRRCVDIALRRTHPWTAPAEYRVSSVSETVLNILLSHYRHFS